MTLKFILIVDSKFKKMFINTTQGDCQQLIIVKSVLSRQ